MFQEEKTFTVRFTLEAAFPEDYEGEEDDYAWLHDWEAGGQVPEPAGHGAGAGASWIAARPAGSGT